MTPTIEITLNHRLLDYTAHDATEMDGHTVAAALAVFLAEVLSNDTSARVVTALAGVITRNVVVYVTGSVLTTNRHFPVVHTP